MTNIGRFLTLVANLLLLLTITPSWGQPVCTAPGCNPTTSDGNFNTAGGTVALPNVDETGTGGFSNTAFGFNALHNTSTGDSNTAIGTAALPDNTTGSQNTAAGFQALSSNVAGGNNTAVGAKALKKSLGTKNIGIGYQAGVALTSGNNNIYIGNQGVGDENQTIRIGTAQTSTFIAGIASNNSGNAVVVIDTTTGQLGFELIASSARYKRDIAPMGTQSQKVLALRPVTFAYKDEVQGGTHYGLVAEEVAAVYPELVTRTATGEVQRVKYQELIPMLVNELQHEHQARQEDRAEMASLRKELAELRVLMGRQAQ